MNKIPEHTTRTIHRVETENSLQVDDDYNIETLDLFANDIVQLSAFETVDKWPF